MTRWQLSLRTILFVLLPAVAVIAVAVRNAEPRLVRTGNPFHLAIAGDGFFCVQDQLDGRSRYTRGGQLTVDSSSQLGLRIDGEVFTFLPPIIIPHDRRQIQIDANGYVSVLSEELYVQQGQLELATFSAPNVPILSENLFRANDETGSPTVQVPGACAAGEIKQRHLEQRALIWHRESIVTLLIGFALGALASAAMLYRRPTT
jgi:flagellar basal body rod protein FlgG